MTQRWSVLEGSLEIQEMPFYWRLSSSSTGFPGIPARLGLRVRCNHEFDYLEYEPNEFEWQAIEMAYRQNENIGFVNPESGQIDTYGSSVNRFFHEVIKAYMPQKIYEIGCGAGFSIQYLKENGWSVTGVDPSEYSLQWSRRLGFSLLNEFFDGDLLAGQADFIFCNDVFEHVRRVEIFSRDVFRALKPGGVFCFATTNSSQSIAIGDISMFEHQHVNMFTMRSIHLILAAAGFTDIEVRRGSYGNTFHVIARKGKVASKCELPAVSCHGYFERALHRIESFEKFYKSVAGRCQFYVPLRCIPYLATVGDFGDSDIFDSNASWRGKFIDGYESKLKSIADLKREPDHCFFIGSMTFYQEIKQTLLNKGFHEQDLYSIASVSQNLC